MISYEAFHSEIVKIAREQKPDATKERIKRGLIVAGTTGAGLGLGEATGRLLTRRYREPLREAGKLVPKRVLRRYGPTAVAGLGALAGALAATHRKKSDEYIHDGSK